MTRAYPFIMVISEDPWHSHLLPSVWQWSCHYLILRLRSVATGDRTPIYHMRGERSTSTPPVRNKTIVEKTKHYKNNTVLRRKRKNLNILVKDHQLCIYEANIWVFYTPNPSLKNWKQNWVKHKNILYRHISLNKIFLSYIKV